MINIITRYLRARIRGVGYALNGIRLLIVSQPHAQLHPLATASVLIGGFLLRIESWEWVAVLLCIGMVWMGEAWNTALELLADEVSLEQRERIGKAKDVAAAGVLMTAIISMIVALVILSNHLHWPPK